MAMKRAGIGTSLSCLGLLSLPQTQITDGVKFEEAASPHLRSSMTLTMISNGDKCGVKGLQAHGFLSHSIKDGIKCRLSLMCHSCRKTRWRTRDETSFRGKCDGVMCFRCPDTDPHHDLEFWFSTCLKKRGKAVGRIWAKLEPKLGGSERWAGPGRRDAGRTVATAIFKDAQHSQHRRVEGGRREVVVLFLILKSG